MDVAISLVDVAFNLLNQLRKSYKPSKSKELRQDIRSIIRELQYIKNAIGRSSGTADDGICIWIADLTEIRERIEDSLEFHNLKVLCKHRNPGAFRQLVHSVRTRSACKKLLDYIAEINQLVAEAKDRVDTYLLPPRAGEAADQSIGAYRHADEAHPVGLETPMAGLVHLLSRGDGRASKLRVLPISGLGGSGKTILAKAAYRQIKEEFDCSAWVTASTALFNNNDYELLVLGAIADKLGMERPPASEDLAEDLSKFLQNKRYLVVIDDLQTTCFWNHILHACPDNGMSSRIIVTTTNEEIARFCCKNCRVHRMQPLGEGSAQDLLVRKAFGENGCPNNLDKSLPMILKTCEYHPLAIVNVADYMRSKERWDDQDCKGIVTLLVSKDNEAFLGMNQVLKRTYNSLSHNARMCLLSLIAYPKDYTFNRKSVLRRWSAERLVPCTGNRPELDVLNEYFTSLVDHNIILPKEVSVCGQVKTFQVRQMMLEFINEKASSEKFVTCIDAHVRSLTFSGRASEALMDFKYYTFLRVLELQNCENLTDDNLDTVWKSSMLKYLSIRGSKGVTKVPRNIGRMQCLETLDTRDTRVLILPMEVFLLPKLAHLFGEFQITCRKGNLKKFLSNKNCKLQTLAGFFIDKSTGFIELLPQILTLCKVKILLQQTTPGIEAIDNFLISLKGYFEKDWQMNSPQNILSIDFGDACHLEFKYDPEAPSLRLARSLKLCGMSIGLPNFILSDSFTDLCLSGNNLGVNILDELQALRKCECLKLTEEDPSRLYAEKIVFHSGWFVSLKCLCFNVPKLPKIVIQEMAMANLESLQLFCTNFGGLSGIKYLLRLRELILSSNVSGAEVDDLLQQVSTHPTRPTFLRSPAETDGSYEDIQVESTNIRHLCCTKQPEIGGNVDLSYVRSITTTGSLSSNAPMDFKKFKLLRVLHVENCENLTDSILDRFCNSLPMLKYLSIRGCEGVSKLPENIARLRFLETLDTRGTKVDVLPMEVISLPHITHLFGKFQINCKESNLKFSKNCKLQTLSGFFIDESSGCVNLLPHLPKLKKVKIFVRDAAPSNNVIDDLQLPLKRFFERQLSQLNSSLTATSNNNVIDYSLVPLKGCFERQLSQLNYSSLESLSIDFGNICDLDFLDKLEVPSPCYLQSLKLHGNLTRLPRSLQSNNLREVHLSGIDLGGNILFELQVLQGLEYLKLNSSTFVVGELIVRSEWFMNLRRLCFVVPQLPKIVIQEKAMEGLKSLQLYCEELGGFSGIEHLVSLEEVMLTSDVTGPEADDLLQQISTHPMRPNIFRLSPLPC